MENNPKKCLTFLEMELSRPKLLAKPKKQTKIFDPQKYLIFLQENSPYIS